jgi:hypothetical protein
MTVPALVLVNVTLKPICEPALTLAASAVLLILTVAQITDSEAEASPEPLSVPKLAVFSYLPQLLVVVVLTTCTVMLLLPANVVGV